METALSQQEMKKYKLSDEKFPTRGGYITQPLATRSKDDRPNLVYPIEYQGKSIWPDKQWIWSRDRMIEALANNEVVIRERHGRFSVRFKQYLKDEHGNVRRGKPLSLLNGPFNQEGTGEVRQLFGQAVFDFPKPVSLISQLCSTMINSSDGKEDIIMDFFAGSCTTAHAVLALNRGDSGSRRFIMVQFAEPTPEGSAARRAGYPTISEIGKDRIRRVIVRMQEEEEGKLAMQDRVEPEDLGFRVYKLARSHFKAWPVYEGESIHEAEQLFDRFESPLVEGWQPQNLLVEIMLQEGFPLDSAVGREPGLAKNAVHCVVSDRCEHRLYVCFDKTVAQATVDALPGLLGAQDIFVCLDSALSDEAKMRLADCCNVHVI